MKNINWFIFFFVVTNVISTNEASSKLVKYVNPFIGTSNNGNTFPGAVVPWGMVSVSPHNAPGTPSWYIYSQKYFYEFGHVHISGAGYSDLGSIIITAAKENLKFPYPDNYRTTYCNEYASPGYYKVLLNQLSIVAEVSATERCGIIKFIALENTSLNVIFDIGRSLNLVGGGAIKVISNRDTGF